MTIPQAALLGIVQGLTEFLPVSSSGHLAILQGLFGLDGHELVAFDVLVHMGTLVPVLIVFWSEIWKLIKKPFQKMTLLLILGTLPAVIGVLFLGDSLSIIFSGGLLLAAAYVVTGVFLRYADTLDTGKKRDKDIGFLDALFVGVVQMFAIIPGISRSGSTITASLFRGFDKQTAASFSFLLSIPAILGAFVFHFDDIFRGDVMIETVGFAAGLTGFLTAMVSGYFAIKVMLKLIKSKKLGVFSYYVFALAAFLVLDHFVLGMVF